MSKAAAFIRKSKGSDDDIGLKVQRDGVVDTSHDMADEVDVYDLGIHTGFSIHSRARDDERIDANPKVDELLERIRDGEYDYLVAWDDRRIARDEFFATVERACLLNDTEIVYVEEDIDTDTMSHDVRRAVEKRIKQEEVQKAVNAIRERVKNGHFQGRPPFGFTLDDHGQHLVPDDKFDTAIRVLELRNQGASYRDIADETGVSRGTIGRIFDRRDLYESHTNTDDAQEVTG